MAKKNNNNQEVTEKLKKEPSFIAESYQPVIDELEVSEDTSSNIKTAKTFIQDVFSKEAMLSNNDVLRLMEKVIEHFNFDEKSTQDIIKYTEDAFSVKEKSQEEKLYQEEILNRAKNSKKVDKIFAPMDYRDKTGMIYAIKGYDEEGSQQTYIGTASKKIYEIDKAKAFGIIPTHEEDIDTKFTLSNFGKYVEGKTVIAKDLFNSIMEVFKKYIVVPKEFFNVLVTYIMMTYVYILFQVIPYLWINGEKGTGKSTLMKLISKLCFNPMYASGATSANIYRQIDNDGSTIILDEFEGVFGDEKQEFIKILNQGFNADGVVPRCIGQNHQIKQFRSFSPKVLGGISNIDDVLFERCIKYTTQRIEGAKVTKYRNTKKVREMLEKLVDDLYIFGYIYAPRIKEIYDSLEISFEGNTLREDDLWNSLLCIAKVIDEENNNTEVTDNLLKYAKQLSNEKFKRNIENEPKLQLLYDLHEYFDYYLNANVTVELNDGRKGVEITALFEYLSNKDEFKWIKNSSSLGKYLTQWYKFEKKREVGKTKNDQIAKIKRTYYIFTKEDILKIMEDNHIKPEDYE